MATIYLFDKSRILLMERTGSRVIQEPFWAGIGGHFEENELGNPEACILRELNEETGLCPEDICEMKLRYLTIRTGKDKIRQQYIFFAKLKNTSKELLACSEGPVAWVETSEIFSKKMSFTNHQCLKHYFGQGMEDELVYVGAVAAPGGKPRINWVPLEEFSREYTPINSAVQIFRLDSKYRKCANNLLRERWYSTVMVLRGEVVDLSTVDGYVATAGGKMEGLVTFRFTSSGCEILSLDSLSEGRGIATALIGSVANYARTGGCKRLYLLTTNDNIHAIRFYQRHGFDICKFSRNALASSRQVKPEIPLLGDNDIPLRHEIEFEYIL